MDVDTVSKGQMGLHGFARKETRVAQISQILPVTTLIIQAISDEFRMQKKGPEAAEHSEQESETNMLNGGQQQWRV